MKKQLIIFLGNLLFWYVLFVAARLLFLIYHWDQTCKLSFSEALNTLRFGFLLDISMSAYLTILPGFALIIASFIPGKWLIGFLKIYSILVAFLFSLIIIVDAGLYTFWGFRLDATPLFYMNNLKAMTASASTITWIGGILLIILSTLGIFRLYILLFRRHIPITGLYFTNILLLTIILAGLFIPVRGGIGISSLTISSAYFSDKQFANHAAINPMWNVAFSITESKDIDTRYSYFPETKMHELAGPFLNRESPVSYVLKNDHPNILLLIVESLTAKGVGVTGGRPGVTPNLDSIARDGILFDRILASADRTDKGLAAIIAGYPSLPGSSPLKFQKLTQVLPFLPQKLNEAGYKTSFLYGGTLDFANYRSFLNQAGYQNFISDENFRPDELASKWGAWDHVLLNRVLDETPSADSNFFKTILTLTSHEPFEIPVQPLFKGNDQDTRFLNSLHYTDKAIGDFVRQARKQDWWKNTLLIIIADHGSRHPKTVKENELSLHRIPMIWTGGALMVKDTVIHTVGSQTDLVTTLLGQLNIDSREFIFSKNILSPSPDPYAFFTFNEGFGFLTHEDFLVYNTLSNRFMSTTQQEGSILHDRVKAYLQYIYTDFFTPMQKP
jgi:phosphoglycerol transferase MdoB-like AlkP superfamily enzyme